MIIFLIIGLILGAISVIFISQNTDVVAITFLGWQMEGSLALIILGSILMGAIISLLFTLPEAISSSFRMNALRREKRDLEKRVTDIKANSVSTENKTVYIEQELPPRT